MARKVCSYLGPEYHLCGCLAYQKKILYYNKLRRNFFSKDFERHRQCKCITYRSGQSSGLSWGSGSTGDGEVSLDQRKAPNTMWFLLPKISHVPDGYLVSLCQGTENSTILSTCSDLHCGFVSYYNINKQRTMSNFMVKQQQKSTEKLYRKCLWSP